MALADKMRTLFAERRDGHSLPQPLYIDPAVHDFDIQAIFQRHWIQAGLESEIPEPGDYLTLTIGASSVTDWISSTPDSGIDPSNPSDASMAMSAASPPLLNALPM